MKHEHQVDRQTEDIDEKVSFRWCACGALKARPWTFQGTQTAWADIEWVDLDPDRPCPHEHFESTVTVIRLEDSGLFQAEVKVLCSTCKTPFVFPEHIGIGLDLHGIATNLDGTELRIAISPKDETVEGLTR